MPEAVVRWSCDFHFPSHITLVSPTITVNTESGSSSRRFAVLTSGFIHVVSLSPDPDDVEIVSEHLSYSGQNICCAIGSYRAVWWSPSLETGSVEGFTTCTFSVTSSSGSGGQDIFPPFGYAPFGKTAKLGFINFDSGRQAFMPDFSFDEESGRICFLRQDFMQTEPTTLVILDVL